MSAQDYDELQRPLPSRRAPMKIETPEKMARAAVMVPPYPTQAGGWEKGFAAGVRADRKTILSVLMSALSSADPFPLLRALAADLGGESLNRDGAGNRARLIADGHSVACAEFGSGGPTEGCPGCALPPPPTLPGFTEHADMALRFRYEGGVFIVPCDGQPYHATVARPEHYAHVVHGLSVRIVYEHTKADAAAALDCAESWQARMMGAGAREVVVMGEERET